MHTFLKFKLTLGGLDSEPRRKSDKLQGPSAISAEERSTQAAMLLKILGKDNPAEVKSTRCLLTARNEPREHSVV